MQAKQKILFIINPISGITQKKRIPEKIAKYLDHTIYDAEIRYTLYRHHAVVLAKEAVEEQFDVVVAIGGDGSIHEVSSSLVNTDVALAVIPLGSGNGWARHFKIPLNVEDAIKLLNKKNKIINADTCTINGRHFINCAGVGFDGAVANHFATTKLRGFFSYIFSTLRQYAIFKPIAYEIIMDHAMVKNKYFMISVMNGSQFGYNIKSVPHAKIDDGILDILLIRPFPKWWTPIMILHTITNTLLYSRFVTLFHSSNVEILMKEASYLQLDGEPVKVRRRLMIHTYNKNLKMLVPNKFHYVKT